MDSSDDDNLSWMKNHRKNTKDINQTRRRLVIDDDDDDEISGTSTIADESFQTAQTNSTIIRQLQSPIQSSQTKENTIDLRNDFIENDRIETGETNDLIHSVKNDSIIHSSDISSSPKQSKEKSKLDEDFRKESETESVSYTPHSVKEIIAVIKNFPESSPTTNNLIADFKTFQLSPMSSSSSSNSGSETNQCDESKSMEKIQNLGENSEVLNKLKIDFEEVKDINDLSENVRDETVNKNTRGVNYFKSNHDETNPETQLRITETVINDVSPWDKENNANNKDCPIDCDVSTQPPSSKRSLIRKKSSSNDISTTSQKVTTSETVDISDDNAWKYDAETDEYFLSGHKCSTKDKRSITDDLNDDDWPDLRLPKSLFHKLFDHQKVGVQWMASMHNCGIGGILGDDMGMGKTFQTLSFLGGLMRQRTIKNALIVAPVSVLRTWEKETRNIFKKHGCLPNITVTVLSSDIAKSRRRHLLMSALGCKAKYPHIVITTYGLVASSPLDLLPSDYKGRSTKWDYVVLDEGHKIKNASTKVNKGCRIICEGDGKSGRSTKDNTHTRRLLLTGTPIQNNLKELWALFDWATNGKLLGKQQTFRNRFAIPIEDARHKDAIPSTIRIANKVKKELQNKIQPHFLQRLKKTTFTDELPTKKELVVWTHISSKQRKMYEDYLFHSGKVQKLLNGEIRSPLEAITYLKKVCGHPSLIRTKHDEVTGLSNQIEYIDKEQLIKDSAKLQALLALVNRLNESGHRILIFSQSTKMLDIIEDVLKPIKMGRIDGQTKEKDRQYLVEKFNKEGSKILVMLLSTKAAGLGLTLTGADRAIIYDPSWNPAEDSQAVDRCYRIGQTKTVTVYRLIAAGTVEERMYEKQVHKDGIRRAILTSGGDATERHFDKAELQRMFTLEPIGKCEMMQKLGNEKTQGGTGRPSFLESHHSVVGITSHDLIYTNEEINVDANEESLFSSTPLLATTYSSKHDINYDNDVDLVKSKNALQTLDSNRDENLFPLGGGRWKNKSRAARELIKNRDDLSGDSQRDENVDDHSSLKSHIPENQISVSKIEKCFVKVDEFVSQNENLELCMNILLDILESDCIDKAIKVRLHKKIACTANMLGWL